MCTSLDRTFVSGVVSARRGVSLVVFVAPLYTLYLLVVGRVLFPLAVVLIAGYLYPQPLIAITPTAIATVRSFPDVIVYLVSVLVP